MVYARSGPASGVGAVNDEELSMSLSINGIQLLHYYAVGVMNRANCHAPNVDEIYPAILGWVLCKHLAGTIKVKSYNGSPANILWWTSALTSNHYACAYNHNTGEIEIRARTQNGAVLHSFNNATSLALLKQIFDVL
jgi:Integron cassette protein VCH_CASS1 chain